MIPVRFPHDGTFGGVLVQVKNYGGTTNSTKTASELAIRTMDPLRYKPKEYQKRFMSIVVQVGALGGAENGASLIEWCVRSWLVGQARSLAHSILLSRVWLQ